MSGTLGERLAAKDERAFVGRREELERLERLFADDPRASVAFVHGRGGIGKSALLRELARRAERRGWTPRFVEGRDLAPTPDALEDALSGVREERRPLLVLDSYERMAALGGYLRRGLLPSLSDRALVVIASRNPPEGGWFREGWEHLTTALELGPLSDDEGSELLRAHGIDDEGAAREALAWGRGLPLALTLAAEVGATGASTSPDASARRAELLRTLLDRVADAEVDAAHADALSAAAIARVTTPDLLDEVLSGGDSSQAFEWLATRTFVEPVGEGVALHDEIRIALREELRHADPARERELRRRIADHLYARTRAGDRRLTIDLAHLVESPAVRWGYSWEGSSAFRIDDVRPGDAARVDELLASTGYARHWRETRRFFEHSPEHVAVARDADDRICGYTVAITPGTAPPFAAADPVLGRWLEHAAGLDPAGEAVLWRDSVDLTRDPRSGVIAMLGMAGVLRSTLESPRYAYLPINPRLEGALEFSAAVGARHISELDALIGPVEIECHLLDYGEGGILAAQRDLVYRELGLVPPEPDPGERTGGVDFAAVRDALRGLKVPRDLATSPLATGATPRQRAESVSALLREAADQAFGSSPEEQLLRQVLLRGYIEPAASHELAASELHLSRSAYFRRLRAATARVTDYLGERLAGPRA